jgi:hypothetical protein
MAVSRQKTEVLRQPQMHSLPFGNSVRKYAGLDPALLIWAAVNRCAGPPVFLKLHCSTQKGYCLGLCVANGPKRKCRYKSCGRYFLNGTRSWEYRHGTFCSRKHQNWGSAAAATSERRTRVHDKLIDLASKQLASWRISGPHWQDDTKLKRRLAAELSHRISEDPNLHGYLQGATVHWVTRNQIEIEKKRLERRREVTSE